MSFMISRETENVHSSKDVEDAFRALTEGADKDFVTEQELYQVYAFFKIKFLGNHPFTAILKTFAVFVGWFELY